MTVIDRFLKLVSYETTSDENSETCPSTPNQKVLGAELVRQMQELGIADAQMDEHGYVYGTIPANCEKELPVLGLIAHMDTSPDASGKDIKARITDVYSGGDIVLNEEKGIVLSPKDFPSLLRNTGKHLIVTDGTTLRLAPNTSVRSLSCRTKLRFSARTIRRAWRKFSPRRSCC